MIKSALVSRYGIPAYSTFIKYSEWLQPIVLVLLRLHWGFQFFQSGLGKLQNHDRTVQFFTQLGIPLPALNAWFVGGVECLGGLLLLIGLASRPVALVLAINMFVAYLSVASDRDALLGLFVNPEAFIAADPFFFLFVSLFVLAFGPGKISIDALLRKAFREKIGTKD